MKKNQFVEIHHFVAIAELGSFTLAAQALGMTGSALSKSVVRLETRLGTKLFHRTTRRISLTGDGMSYLADCKSAITILDKAENRLSSEQKTPAGNVRIELPVAFGRRFILPTLIDLSMKFEKLELSITFNDSPSDLRSSGIDLAVRVGKLDDIVDLVARRLGEQQRVICGSPSYFARCGLPHSKEDLNQHECIVGWPLGQRHCWFLKHDDGTTGAYEIPVRHEIADCEGILTAALAGAGLAQAPMWLVEQYLQTGELISVLDEMVADNAPIHVMWLKKPYIQPKLRVIIEALVLLAKSSGSPFSAQEARV